ncbi:hypothetical protein FH972_023973 [Carpinus fangiana]|uniref:Uncharacterized protein n=1 Tax=Carpinus fangiana TaxID=176857 RepID=A0A5N6KWQ5_9ROSI|nr:hypothetical protein FH972_023973 [Carpinus fangiana]
MAEASGYSKEEAMRVAQLIMKVDLREDEGTQALEDVACLVFLDDQFAKFAEEHGEQKILGILRKTWGKMTRRGQEMALEIHMEGRSKELLEKALAG